MRRSRTKRQFKNKTRRKQKGGLRNVSISVPKEFSESVKELLWSDNRAKNVQIDIHDEPGVNVTLREIMLRFGATDELLNTKCFAICGPTGVGKTKFINMLKEKYQVQVINMDTMQVYDLISVGTGRTDMSTTRGSHLYGIYNPNTMFHILDYLMDMITAFKSIKENGDPIVFEGASKSLLEVILRVFPNITVFGIHAMNEENIVSNITKRITDKVITRAILELSELLKTNKIEFDSPAINNNPEVYSLIVKEFTEAELKDDSLNDNLIHKDSVRLSELTKDVIKKNVELHKEQYRRLKSIPKIIWFSNEDSSIELLEHKFAEEIVPSSILAPTTNFDFLGCSSKRNNPTEEFCKGIDSLFHSADARSTIEYAARLSVPLLPKKGHDQIVIGTTKYLLPYGILSDYFKTFAIKPELWTMEKNMFLIECIASKFINNSIIRIVTTPNDLIDSKHNYRITANEICMLRSYDYNFYKYDSAEFPNIYFCSKTPLTNCIRVYTSEGAFRCKGKELGDNLFF